MKFSRAAAKATCQAKAGQKKPKALLLVAGWLVLACYLLDYSPAGIYVAALAGASDSTHEARVESGENGLQLVLHHTHGCLGHHHGMVGRTLTFFTQPATAGNPDHIIQFGSADNFSSPTQMLPSLPVLAGLPATAPAEISVSVPNSSLAVYQAPRPPPYEGGRMACLRSTVFLI